MSDSEYSPSSYDGIERRIYQSYTESDQIQESVINECYNFYQSQISNNSTSNDYHLFCNSKTSAKVVSYLSVILAGYDSDFQNENLKPIISSITNCNNCLINYHLERTEMSKKLISIKKVPFKAVQLSMDKLSSWEASILNDQLSKILEENDSSNPLKLKNIVLKLIFHSFINPSILRLDSHLKTYFDRCLDFYDEAHTLITIDHNLKIYPGLIYLLFSDNDLQRNWALSKLPYSQLSKSKDITFNTYYKSSDFNPLFIEEYQIHFFNIQKPDFFNNDRAIQFWTNLIPLIRFSSLDAIQDILFEPYSSASFRDDSTFKIYPLMTIFINHIFSYLDTPLPFLLRFLAIILQKFKLSIFDFIKPHNYMSFFDMSFNNPVYKKLLTSLHPNDFPHELLNSDSDRIPYFLDLIKWMDICNHILNDSNKRCQFTIAIFGFMADYIQDQNSGNFIGNYVMQLMTDQLTLQNNIHNDNLNIELTSKASARALINKKCILLYDASRLKSLESNAIKLIKTCLIFDIQNFAYHSIKLNNNQTSITPEFNNDLWKLILAKLSTNGTLLIVPIFTAFKDIQKVFQIDIAYKKTKLLSDKQQQFSEEKIKNLILNCSKHNKIILEFTISVQDILNKYSEYLNPQQVKVVLMTRETSLGFWSCILSPIDSIYESSIAFLNESFDVDDRLEAFKECLKLDVIVTLESFRNSLSNFTSLNLFLPTKRVVKLLIDFIACLFDPISGMLVSSSITIELNLLLKTSIVEFWIDIWSFLGMIFKNIFDWSINYERLKNSLKKEVADQITTDLLNFTRDVLDLSHSVLNGYKVIISLVNTENFKEEDILKIKKTMLNPIINTLQDLFKWLRLSDPALLISCVDLITKILDLSSKDVGMKLDDELLTILIKLCLRAKKFNNKMNAEQTGELLLRARAINDKLVDDISIQVEDEKKKKLQPSSITSTPTYEYQSRKSSQQPNLGSYLKPHIREAIPSLDAPKRLSKLELAQLKLKEKRMSMATPEPAREPAPARPSGFNSKKKPITISDSDSDSDKNGSEDENEHGNNGLFTKEQVVAKMKKTKAALQSLQVPRFNGSTNNKPKDKNSELNKKKKAEELMRLRLNVDMSSLYKTILSWSYNNDKELPSDYEKYQYQPVKDVFDSVEDYQKSFEPLLLLECWQSIQRAKQIEQETPFRMTIGSRSATDSFFDIYASVKKSIVNDLRLFGDNDLLVLMLIDNLPNEDDGVGIPKRLVNSCKLNCFAKVREIKNTVGNLADITLRVSSTNEMVHRISASMEIVGLKVNTMTTLEREYSSLKGLQYYDLHEEIIKAKPAELENLDNSKIERIKRVYDVNDSQAKAIQGTVKSEDGFALIQGPPGTGKTKTILGVIGYFLTREDSSTHRVSVPSSSISSNASVGVNAKRKILICAPSNAAVDELVLRIRKGIKNSKGEVFKPNVVRLGKSDAINEQVKDLTLEEQVDSQMAKFKNNSDDSAAIREEHRKCIVERDELRKKLEDGKLDEVEVGKVEIRLQEVMTKRRQLGKKLDELREERAVNFRNREIERRNLQYKILNNAQVVCSTLSGSAHDVLASMSMTFETVVIDEAAQCIELSAIIPLRYGCKKCIMVGDPNQLPPTVLSQKAASYKYEQSLFVRMQNNHKDSVYLLDVQYRMHPEISQFPSYEFYKSKLKDGPNMDKINTRPWHSIKDFGPYRFFNIQGTQSKNERTKSLYNVIEAKIILEIVENLYRRFPDVDWSNKIGIISPYKEQIRLLKKTFVDKYGYLITKQIDFNTVDGFQGQEKDIILFSCVRAETHTGIGFLSDIRRMNVALTRARASLWVVGSVDALVSNKTWKDLYENAKSRNLITQAYLGFTSQLGSSNGSNTNTKSKNLPIEKPKSSGVIMPPDSTVKHVDDDTNGNSNDSEDGDKKKKKKNKKNKKRKHEDVSDVNTSQMKKIVKPNIPTMPKKKLSGEITKDNRIIKGPTSSGVIPPPPSTLPKKIINNVPEGMVKISKKKNFQLPKGPALSRKK